MTAVVVDLCIPWFVTKVSSYYTMLAILVEAIIWRDCMCLKRSIYIVCRDILDSFLCNSFWDFWELPFVVILIVGGADFFWEIFRFFRPKKWSFSLHGHPVLEMITSSFFIVLQYKPFKNGHRTIGIDAIFSVNNQPARYAFERKPYERGKS